MSDIGILVPWFLSHIFNRLSINIYSYIIKNLLITSNTHHICFSEHVTTISRKSLVSNTSSLSMTKHSSDISPSMSDSWKLNNVPWLNSYFQVSIDNVLVENNMIFSKFWHRFHISFYKHFVLFLHEKWTLKDKDKLWPYFRLTKPQTDKGTPQTTNKMGYNLTLFSMCICNIPLCTSFCLIC